ncbi:MAG TPA: glycoside hydrolase [Gammaproteobacteria bacterium]|nr:glycoside hydrolase [Gammaproteobacteria bacterium]
MEATQKPPLNLVLMWHMHQPEYRNLATGEYHLPWTYLHAIKDYVDMAAHIERNEGARAVVNFAPILLEQLEDYGTQIDTYFATGRKIKDQLLRFLICDEEYRSDIEQRSWLINACLKANEEHLIRRYPAFSELIDTARSHMEAGTLGYLYRQFFIDLNVWYHLAWAGESLKRDNLIIRHLLQKGGDFSTEDRENLLRVIGEQIRSIIPRYRMLAEDGKIELCMSPYSHPMVPLLIDFDAARETQPEAPMPSHDGYPDGKARAAWHIDEGARVFERCFGSRPAGCWPSEGGISADGFALLSEHEFNWVATGDTVLHNCFRDRPDEMLRQCRHSGFSKEENGTKLFFRDDGLSDLIGFTYSKWHADDAVSDLIQHLHNIHEHCDGTSDNIVSIILDGENAWEYYPENGYHFLDALYRRLAEDPVINLTTYSEHLKKKPKTRELPAIVAGSWVYGTFSTWIGEPDKNRAWDLLCKAKAAIDDHIEANPEMATNKALLAQLAVCEGSDWFWWFGDYNPSHSVQDFDQLYRQNLKNLYQLIGQEPPESLDIPLSKGNTGGLGEAEAGGVMRRGS